MGSGQSKFYKSANKQQFPFGPPPPMYNGQYPQPYGMPQPYPAYGQQMYPQQHMPGFVPPGVYGQAAHLPPPMLNWLPQDRKKKSRRSSRRPERHSSGRDKFVGGFAAERPEAPHHARSESRRREDHVPAGPQMPVPRVGAPDSSHRSATPFIPPLSRDSEESEDDRTRSHSHHGHTRQPSHHGHNRPPSRQSVHYSPPESITGDFPRVMQPMEPANPSVFGPTGPRPITPLRNPLPPPPRDIYEMSPYKSLLTMPQTSALLTASYGPHLATVTTGAPAPKVERKKSIGKSLLRAFSKREKKPEQPQVHFVPVFVPADQNNSQTTSQVAVQSYPTATAQQAADLIRSMSQGHAAPINTPRHATAPIPPSAMRQPAPAAFSVAPSTHSADALFPPVPPNPSSPPAVRFDQDSPYAFFLNHSPHRVMYRGVTYPTAAHLFEAFKFIDDHPDIAEAIRACTDVRSLYALANQYHTSVRHDWAYVHLKYMEEVLQLKFMQHPDLRTKLLGTGDARIIYADANDSFWGTGPDDNGTNLLGKALVIVRERIRMENLSAGT